MIPDGTIDSFVNQVVVMLSAFHSVDKHLDLETGHRFNVFDLFRIDEVATSRMLHFLLNPKAPHGQSELFLRLFIEHFVPEWQDAFHYNSAKSVTTGELIDIAISDDNYWIGIENKVFCAPERNLQTDRYLDALESASGRSKGRDYRLIYLSPRGEFPTEYSLSKKGRERHQGKFVIGAWVSYDAAIDAAEDSTRSSGAVGLFPTESCLGWLSECEARCRADSVRWFLRQFRTVIRKRIVPREDQSMTGNAIVDLALRSADNLEVALRIGEERERIKKSVATKLLSNVQVRLESWANMRSEDWDLSIEWPGGNWTAAPCVKYLPILLHRKKWPGMVGAGLSADENGPWQVFVGAMAPTQSAWDNDRRARERYGRKPSLIDDNGRQRIADVLKLSIPREKWWIDWETLRDIDGQDISDWRKIETVKRLLVGGDRLAQYIVDKMVDIALQIDAAIG